MMLRTIGRARLSLKSSPFPQKRAGQGHRRASSTLPIALSPEIKHALNSSQPVLALESTILTHGLPPEPALALAAELESIARQKNVVPAHIALLNGTIQVGLCPEHLQQLLDPRKPPLKLGRRDLPVAISQKYSGGTTVSATMAIADLIGVKVFATGGIGGVHRGAQHTMDISSDLTELARTPIAVICAGIKSILDTPLTLEYLETLGVPVVSFSKSKEFPGFYTDKSGHYAPYSSTSAKECAEIIYNSDALRLKSGILVGVPVPSEFANAGAMIQSAIDRAIEESVQSNIIGKEVTPWLLNRVKELSKGKSVEINIGLIKNNVTVAAQIAAEYSKLLSPQKAVLAITSTSSGSVDGSFRQASHHAQPVGNSPSESRMLVVGAAAVDVSSKLASTNGLVTGSTSPGRVRASLGGVALNITRAAHRLGVNDVVLVSRVGTDAAFGDFLTNELNALGLRTDGLLVDGEARTGVVNMIFDSSGDLVGGVAELESVEQMDGHLLSQMIREKKPEVVCFDANLSAKLINEILMTCHENQKRPIITAFEPTSVSKAMRVLDGLANMFVQSNGRQRLSIMFPNLAELEAINKGVREGKRQSEFESLEWIQSLERLGIDGHFRDAVSRLMPGWATQKGAVQMALGLMPAVETIVIKYGAAGVIVVGRIEGGGPGWVASRGGVMMKHFEAVKLEEHICNVTGAGDALCASVMAAVVDGCKINLSTDWDQMIDKGQRAARETLKTEESVGEI